MVEIETDFQFNGLTLPLNQDSYFQQTIDGPNMLPLFNSLGTLDGSEITQTSVVLIAGSLPLSAAGFVLNHIAVVLDSNYQPIMISNPASLLLIL